MTVAQCPKCATVPESFRITDAMNRLGFIGRGKRLTCTGCGTRLAIRGLGANVSWILVYTVVVIQFVWIRNVADETAQVVALVAVLALALYLHYKLVSRLVRLEIPAFGEADTTSLVQALRTAGIAEDAAGQETEPVHEVDNAPRTKWRCTSCQEENPEGFEICWKCGASWDAKAAKDI